MQPGRQNTFQPNLDYKQTYIPKGQNVLQEIFKDHFEEFKEKYDEKYATTYGNYRIERITEVVEECSTKLSSNCSFNKVIHKM